MWPVNSVYRDVFQELCRNQLLAASSLCKRLQIVNGKKEQMVIHRLPHRSVGPIIRSITWTIYIHMGVEKLFVLYSFNFTIIMGGRKDLETWYSNAWYLRMC